MKLDKVSLVERMFLFRMPGKRRDRTSARNQLARDDTFDFGKRTAVYLLFHNSQNLLIVPGPYPA